MDRTRATVLLAACLCLPFGPPAPAAEWTLDLSAAAIPQEPATGELLGKPFSVESAQLQGSVLTLRQGEGFIADREIVLFAFLENRETLEGKTLSIDPDTGFGSPHVHVKWKSENAQEPGIEFHVGGYAMRLEMGRRVGNQIPGAIYLCLPDEERSVVAGTFSAQIEGSHAGGGGRGLDEFVPPELDLTLMGDLPREPTSRAKLIALVVFALTGALLCGAGGLWFLVVAFTKHVGWGLAVLLVPFAGLVFFFMNIERSLKPFLLSLVGSLMLLASGWGIVSAGAEHLLPALLEAQARQAGEAGEAPAAPGDEPPVPDESAPSLFVKVGGPIVLGDPADLVVENFGPPRGRMKVGPREMLSYERTAYVIEDGRVVLIIDK